MGNNSIKCPRCNSDWIIKSGRVKGKQRYNCKDCNYFFTVSKLGKRLDNYYVVKALQLYLQGLGYREIERILGISHVTVMKWVKQYFKEIPEIDKAAFDYQMLDKKELAIFLGIPDFVEFKEKDISGYGFSVAKVGEKYMLMKWRIQDD